MLKVPKWVVKALGGLPAVLPAPEPSAKDLTLRAILEAKGNMNLASRKRVLLDGLSCSITRPAKVDANAMDTDAGGMDLDEDCDVEKLAPVLLKLNIGA